MVPVSSVLVKLQLSLVLGPSKERHTQKIIIIYIEKVLRTTYKKLVLST